LMVGRGKGRWVQGRGDEPSSAATNWSEVLRPRGPNEMPSSELAPGEGISKIKAQCGGVYCTANDRDMKEVSSSKLNRRIALDEVTINSREPCSSIRCVDSRINGGERNVAETVERVDCLRAVGGIDDGVVLGLVVIGTAESWKKFD